MTDPWKLETVDFEESVLRDRNSVYAVSNGYLTLKGNLAELRGADHPTTLVAGVFDAADWIAFIRPTKYERRFHDPEYFDGAPWSPSVANLPDPVHLRVFLGERELTFRSGRIRAFRQEYDLRRGVYRYEYEHENPDGLRTRIRMERFCSMRHPHRAWLRYTLTPIDHESTIRILSGINGAIRSNLHNEKQVEVLDLLPGDPGECRLRARTVHTGIDVDVAVRTRFRTRAVHRGRVLEESALADVFEARPRRGEPVILEKAMVVATGEDPVHGAECDVPAEIRGAAETGFEGAWKEQETFWKEAWERLDVRIEGDDVAQRNLRFCLMHLMSAAPRHSRRLSVPCKLLTGEYYQGTVFYDTDLYIEPVFLFSFPEIARSMLNYRWHGLEPGRRIARELGYRGAKFAWQAGPYGEEELGRWWKYTYLNIHIDADVCYSLMLYFHATGDFDFLAERGIDILVESARFYVSRADADPDGRTFHLRVVAGPDEGHPESNDNFYTNHLAARCLRDAAAVLERMKEERQASYEAARKRLSIADGEPAEWLRVAEGLRILYHPDSRIYEQCEGFFDLEEAPEDLMRDRPFWWAIVYPYRVIYQPDACMALVLDRDRFDPEVLGANHRYYKPITLNFSSMSYGINAILGALCDDMEYAYEQFMIAATLDLDPAITGRNDTHEGIHGTNAGGAWMAAVLGFGGLTVTGTGIRIDPRLPEKWASLTYRFRIRGESVTCRVTPDAVRLESAGESGKDLTLTVRGRTISLPPGGGATVPARGA